MGGRSGLKGRELKYNQIGGKWRKEIDPDTGVIKYIRVHTKKKKRK